MASFSDAKGRVWQLGPLTIGDRIRVKASSNGTLDLLSPTEPRTDPLCNRLLFDFDLLWELLSHLVEPQLKLAGVSLTDFAEAMAGDNLVEAQDVFFKEWQDFFHRLRRIDTAKAIERMAAYKKTAAEMLTEKLKTAGTPTLDQKAMEIIHGVLSESFGNSPELSDSIQGHLV